MIATHTILVWTSRLAKGMWDGYNIAAWIVCKVSTKFLHPPKWC